MPEPDPTNAADEDCVLDLEADESAEPARIAEADAAQTEAAAEAPERPRCATAKCRAILRQLLDELIADYASDDRGVEIREIAGGYRMATKPECHDAVRVVCQEPQAGAQAFAARAGDPGRGRLQAAGHRA